MFLLIKYYFFELDLYFGVPLLRHASSCFLSSLLCVFVFHDLSFYLMGTTLFPHLQINQIIAVLSSF